MAGWLKQRTKNGIEEGETASERFRNNFLHISTKLTIMYPPMLGSTAAEAVVARRNKRLIIFMLVLVLRRYCAVIR